MEPYAGTLITKPTMRSPVPIFTKPPATVDDKHDEMKQTAQFLFACAGAESDLNTFLPALTDILNVQVQYESLWSIAHQWLSHPSGSWIGFYAYTSR